MKSLRRKLFMCWTLKRCWHHMYRRSWSPSHLGTDKKTNGPFKVCPLQTPGCSRNEKARLHTSHGASACRFVPTRRRVQSRRSRCVFLHTTTCSLSSLTAERSQRVRTGSLVTSRPPTPTPPYVFGSQRCGRVTRFAADL